MITGGTLVPAAAGKPASIANGVTQRFTKGDVIIVARRIAALVFDDRLADDLPRSPMGRA